MKKIIFILTFLACVLAIIILSFYLTGCSAEFYRPDKKGNLELVGKVESNCPGKFSMTKEGDMTAEMGNVLPNIIRKVD